MLRAALLFAALVVAHLRTSRKRGSHPEKSHGSWSPNNPFDSKRASRAKAAERGRKMAAARKTAGGKRGAGKRATTTVTPVGPRRIRAQELVLDLRKQPYRHVVPEPTKLKASERKKLAAQGNYDLITPDTLKPEVLDAAHDTLRGANEAITRMFPDNPNRWNGDTRFSTIEESDRHHAAFDPSSGQIDVAPYLMEDSDGQKFPTLIHEMFHAHTPGNPDAFSRFRGFEEGLAEKMTRLHRRDILAASLGDERADAIERKARSRYDRPDGAYQGYIDALETYRTHTGEDERAFYDGLYRVPLEDRSDHLDRKARAWIKKNLGESSPEGTRAVKTIRRADDFLRRGEGAFDA